MNQSNPFKWRHYEAQIILLCVRWYLRYPLSYRNLEEMMQERRIDVDHTTINRWVQKYASELEKRCRRYLKPTNDSYRVDETYIKIKGKWKYLYRALDSLGNTIDFMMKKSLTERELNKLRKYYSEFRNFEELKGWLNIVH